MRTVRSQHNNVLKLARHSVDFDGDSVKEGLATGHGLLDELTSPYFWTPVQCGRSVRPEIYSLHLQLTDEQAGHASPHPIDPGPAATHVVRPLVCHVVGGACILCQGVVIGRFARPEHGTDLRVGQLPEGCRPNVRLRFAAVARGAHGEQQTLASNFGLVTLDVTPDGWILAAGCDVDGILDLSAVRFCIDKGIELLEEARLHTVQLAGTYFAMLQGALVKRRWKKEHLAPIAILPEHARPRRDHTFVVASDAPRGYHLVRVQPSHKSGRGGDIFWVDAVWGYDVIHLSGMFFETVPAAATRSEWRSTIESETIEALVNDCQRYLIRRFGSPQKLRDAIDLYGNGVLGFTEFSTALKSAGYVGNAIKIWHVLDADGDGHITFDRLFQGYSDTRRCMAEITQLPEASLLSDVPANLAPC